MVVLVCLCLDVEASQEVKCGVLDVLLHFSVQNTLDFGAFGVLCFWI